jgi:hypothetical protein
MSHNSNSDSIIEHITNKEDISDKDSSIISDMSDNDSVSDAFTYDKNKEQKKKETNSVDSEVEKEYIQTVVLDRVIKYIKIDDIIQKKQTEFRKEMKTIKESKDILEKFLIDYLDKIDEEFIQVGEKNKLVKTVTTTKSPPKMEDIASCLVDGFKKYGIYEDENEIKRVVKDFINNIEEKREVKTKKYLKRQVTRERKKNNNKKKVNKGS